MLADMVQRLDISFQGEGGEVMGGWQRRRPRKSFDCSVAGNWIKS